MNTPIDRIHIAQELQKWAHPTPWRITVNAFPQFCNWRCEICREHSPLNKTQLAQVNPIPWEWIQQIINHFANDGLQEVIPGTMGEPFLNPYLPDFIQVCLERQLRLNILTNGTFGALSLQSLPIAISNWEKQLHPLANRLKLQFGITKTAQELKKLGVLDAISQWQNLCLGSTTLQITLQKSTLADLEFWLNFAKSNEISRIKLNHLVVHYVQLEQESLHRDNLNNFLSDFKEKAQNMQIQVSGSVFKQQLESSISPLQPTRNCPFLGKEAWLNEKGELYACPHPDQPIGSICPKNCPYI